ncbi:MAG: iron-containing alcohol dehydrogenase [Bacilli bacterium]
MENFIYDIPTKIYFGKNQLVNIREIIPKYGNKILLVYGGGSIKKNGIYNEVYRLLKGKVEIFELSGVESNPQISTVKKGVDICKIANVELILAVGGGSVIDCAKLVAAGCFYENDAWDLVLNPLLIKKALPIITVLTIAATGSEMDHIAVLSNKETKEKIGTRNPLLRPKISILDPTYTFTVGKYQTAAGIVDIMSHAMESYFSNIEADFQNKLAEAIIKTCIKNGRIAINNPNNYEARSNLMWASSWAINDILKLGHNVQWSVHPIEHQLSAVYDITHGVGLAIITPHWMEYVLDEDNLDIFYNFAVNVWNIEESNDKEKVARKGIMKLKDFFVEIGLENNLSSLGITNKDFSDMAEKVEKQLKGSLKELTKYEIIEIYERCL